MAEALLLRRLGEMKGEEHLREERPAKGRRQEGGDDRQQPGRDQERQSPASLDVLGYGWPLGPVGPDAPDVNVRSKLKPQ
jgi:hypothetical protein